MYYDICVLPNYYKSLYLYKDTIVFGALDQYFFDKRAYCIDSGYR